MSAASDPPRVEGSSQLPGAKRLPAVAPPSGDQPSWTYSQRLGRALKEVLIEQGIFSADDLHREVLRIDSASPHDGARLVARAWLDDSFRSALLSDPRKAARQIGIDVGPRPIRVLENTELIHNVIVCTLCSCYPRFLLGQPPDWYKSTAYRSRVVTDPRSVLAEFGTFITSDRIVRVHDSTAELRYMVLPLRPAGTQALDESQLVSLITRDCLIGVTEPRLGR
jgi:nitrile hydratase